MENWTSRKFIEGTRLRKIPRPSSSSKDELAARGRKYPAGASGEVELGNSNAETTETSSAGKKRIRDGKQDYNFSTRDHRDTKEESTTTSKRAKSGADNRNFTIARKAARRDEDARVGSAIFAASTRPPSGPENKLFRGGEGLSKPRHSDSVSSKGYPPIKDVSAGRGATGKMNLTPAGSPRGPVMGKGEGPSGPKGGAHGGTSPMMVGTDEGRHGKVVIPSVALRSHNEVGDGSRGWAEHAEGRGEDADDSNSGNGSYASDGTNDRNDGITYDNSDDDNSSNAIHGISSAVDGKVKRGKRVVYTWKGSWSAF
jgi:hypothetical protein